MLKNIFLNIKNSAEEKISSKSNILNNILTGSNNEFQGILDKLNNKDKTIPVSFEKLENIEVIPEMSNIEIQFKAFQHNDLFTNKNSIKTVFINDKKISFTANSDLEKISNKTIKNIINSAIKNNLNIVSITIENDNMVATKVSNPKINEKNEYNLNKPLKTNDLLNLKFQNEFPPNKIAKDIKNNTVFSPNTNYEPLKTKSETKNITNINIKEPSLNNQIDNNNTDNELIKVSNKDQALFLDKPEPKPDVFIKIADNNKTSNAKTIKEDIAPYEVIEDDIYENNFKDNSSKKASSILSSYAEKLNNKSILNVDKNVIETNTNKTTVVADSNSSSKITQFKNESSILKSSKIDNKEIIKPNNTKNIEKLHKHTTNDKSIINEKKSSFIDNYFNEIQEPTNTNPTTDPLNTLDESITFKFKDLQNKKNFSEKLTSEIAKALKHSEVKPESSTQVKIIIQPKSLGRMDIIMTNKGDKLDLNIRVSNKGVENILTESLFTLKEKIESSTTFNVNNINIYSENSKSTENNMAHRRVEENYSENNNDNKGNNSGRHKEDKREEKLNFEELQEEYLSESFK